MATLVLLGCSDPARDPMDAALSDAALADAAVADAPVPDATVQLDAAPASGWRTEPPVPEPIQEITGAVHEGRLWIAGGIDDAGGTSRVVRIFDPSTSSWSEGPLLPAPRHHAMLVSTGDALYLLGGMETLRFDPLDTAWVLRDGAWSPIASLPEPRGAGTAGFVAGLIVIAGGNSGRGGLASSTLRYDPARDVWSTGTPIPTQREHTAGLVHDGELWVVAGRLNSLDTNQAAVEIYDPATDTWRTGPSIPTARGGHGVAVLDGIAYATGGEQPDRALDSVEALDLVTGAWSAVEPIPTPRHGHVALAAAGRIWIVGGGDRPIFAAVDVVESFAP